MTTEQIFKKIYNELKKQITDNPNKTFFKEYTIPSINYKSNNQDIENLYFASGIEMELYKMMEYFENKVYFASYKDRYFFSNDDVTLQKNLAFKISEEEKCENIEEM